MPGRMGLRAVVFFPGILSVALIWTLRGYKGGGVRSAGGGEEGRRMGVHGGMREMGGRGGIGD